MYNVFIIKVCFIIFHIRMWAKNSKTSVVKVSSNCVMHIHLPII